jgi:HAD superfamily hydrolase (TIGR01509 family)
MARYDAVVFDLDGTLLNTERPGMEAGRAALAEFGFEIPLETMCQLVGKDTESGDALLQKILGGALTFEQLLPVWRKHYEARFPDGIPLMPGVADLLDHLDGTGLPRAVATSSRMKPAQRKLERSGLSTRFATVVTFDCVARPKPAPDAYVLAAERLGFDPTRCLAFEDSDTGAASAKAAGMTVVQIPDMLPTDGAHAHHVAETLLAGAQMAGLID